MGGFYERSEFSTYGRKVDLRGVRLADITLRASYTESKRGMRGHI